MVVSMASEIWNNISFKVMPFDFDFYFFHAFYSEDDVRHLGKYHCHILDCTRKGVSIRSTEVVLPLYLALLKLHLDYSVHLGRCFPDSDILESFQWSALKLIRKLK